MDPETIEDFRRILRARWERVHHRRRGTMSAVEGLLQSHEPDWEDVAADRAEAVRLEALSEKDARELAQIHQSLQRLDDGTFGYCAVCRAPIETERLRAMPQADRCSGCTRRQEVTGTSPAEVAHR